MDRRLVGETRVAQNGPSGVPGRHDVMMVGRDGVLGHAA